MGIPHVELHNDLNTFHVFVFHQPFARFRGLLSPGKTKASWLASKKLKMVQLLCNQNLNHVGVGRYCLSLFILFPLFCFFKRNVVDPWFWRLMTHACPFCFPHSPSALPFHWGCAELVLVWFVGWRIFLGVNDVLYFWSLTIKWCGSPHTLYMIYVRIYIIYIYRFQKAIVKTRIPFPWCFCFPPFLGWGAAADHWQLVPEFEHLGKGWLHASLEGTNHRLNGVLPWFGSTSGVWPALSEYWSRQNRDYFNLQIPPSLCFV